MTAIKQIPMDENHAALMNSIYRYQRFIYDFTRKYYLLGRDRLINTMDIRPGDRILEMGCGTARNLIMIAKRNPEVFLYGLDASHEMLATAQRKVLKRKLTRMISLQQGLAENTHYETTFGLNAPFDTVFFSYSLSMIPLWKEALHTALENVKPGGLIYIVDFWDQAGFPPWFRSVLTKWLALFHVRHEPELLSYIFSMPGIQKKSIKINSIWGQYAFTITFQKELTL